MGIGPAGNTGFGGMNRNQTQPSPVPLTGKFVDIYKRLKVITQPAVEPVTLDELKAHLRITTDDEDTYLTGLITASRLDVEEYTRRKLITQTLRMVLDQWPFMGYDSWEGQVEAPIAALVRDISLKLWYPPLQGIDNITITYLDGTSAVYPSANYLVDTSTLDDYGRIALKYDATYVNNLQEIKAISIDYVAGYGDAGTDVPFQIRQAILNYAAWMYTNRGDCADGAKTGFARGTTPLDLSGATGYLQAYRIERLVN